MTNHPALAPGNVAVITGGASGIGLAAAKKYAEYGMRLCLTDQSKAALDDAVDEIARVCRHGQDDVFAVVTDVADCGQVKALKEEVFDRFGQVNVLMNNAGIALRAGTWRDYDNWQQILSVNLWGVINGVHAFTQAMINQDLPACIINTGSKQGITCPPGNTAYNISKAGVKALTEGLQHELRNTDGCKVTAHLLVPGFTYTGMVRAHAPEKPPSAWLPEQLVDYLLSKLGNGDFYIICPDNDVSEEIDRKRILWAAGDLAENRPPLSRWHEDFTSAFEEYMKK